MLINDVLFLFIIFIFLIILYGTMARNWKWKSLYRIKDKYLELDKNYRKRNYTRSVSVVGDKEKIIFEDIVILIAAFTLMILFITKAIFFAAVASGSMSPTINKYDMVMMQNIDHRYNVGDIIMFESPDTAQPVTHRIKSIDEEGTIRTAGDATGVTDWWKLKKENIVGKAVIILENPITIKNFGRYFIAEDKNQRFGPFDYNSYILFFEVIKLYGYAIASICILTYIFLEFNRLKKMKDQR